MCIRIAVSFLLMDCLFFLYFVPIYIKGLAPCELLSCATVIMFLVKPSDDSPASAKLIPS